MEGSSDTVAGLRGVLTTGSVSSAQTGFAAHTSQLAQPIKAHSKQRKSDMGRKKGKGAILVKLQRIKNNEIHELEAWRIRIGGLVYPNLQPALSRNAIDLPVFLLGALRPEGPITTLKRKIPGNGPAGSVLPTQR